MIILIFTGGDIIKKRIPGWAADLSGMAAGLILVYLSVLLPSSGFGSFLMTLGIFAFWGFQIALVVYGVKALIRLVSRNHTDPEEQTYGAISSGTEVDHLADGMPRVNKRYVYNRNETFRFNSAPEPLSWGGTFLMLFLLFPVGFCFLIIKTIREAGRCYRNGTVLQVVGGLIFILTFAFVLLIVLSGADSLQALLGATALPGYYSVAGLLLFIYGTWLKQRGKTNDSYLKLITMERVTSIDTLAAREKTDYAHASAIVDRLIDSGLLGEAYLSHADRQVIVPGISKKTVRKCRNCSASTVLFSTDPQICDYCGGPL